MNVTKHFSVEEFSCNDGTPYPEEWIAERLVPLCKALELIRAIWGRPIKINSGYRTPTYNKKVGGSRASKHMDGIAADITMDGIYPTRVFEIMDRLMDVGAIPKGGLHAYNTFVHYDTRGKVARW